MSIQQKMNEALTQHFENIQIPQEVDQKIRQSFIQFHKKEEKRKMKKRMIVMGLTAALLIPTGVFAVNSSYFANTDKNLNGLVDSGVQLAVSEGLTVPLDEKISDQGITIHLKELYVEDSRILVHYRIETQDGELVPYSFDTTGIELRTDGKKDEKQVENPTYNVPGQEGFHVLNFIEAEQDKLPFYLTDQTGKEIETGVATNDKPEGMIAFVTSGVKFSESINLNVSVNRIGGVKGSWKGQIPIDQSKASQATQTAR